MTYRRPATQPTAPPAHRAPAPDEVLVFTDYCDDCQSTHLHAHTNEGEFCDFSIPELNPNPALVYLGHSSGCYRYALRPGYNAFGKSWAYILDLAPIGPELFQYHFDTQDQISDADPGL